MRCRKRNIDEKVYIVKYMYQNRRKLSSKQSKFTTQDIRKEE